ncbi:MAG: hypothetical protein CR967_01660 [Proteobacteria bacterium]|nr:MAG: hypothetical protein CR967_01660 [Pseudomonadota bacterium]
MKKLLVIFLGLLVSSSFLNAQGGSKFLIHELVLLPHPGKVLKQHAKEIGVTKQEMQRIKKEVKAVYPPIFQGKTREAFKLEKKLKRMVLKGKTKADVKDLLDKIAKLKREAIDSRIDALNKFREIVGEEKWKKIINFKK